MRRLVATVGAVVLVAASVSPALASTWSDPGTQWNAHAPFTVKMLDNTTGAWPARVAAAAADWSVASAVDAQIVSSAAKVTINNQYFGSNYPCGAAIIYKSGQGSIKNVIINLNDTCTDTFSEALKQTVICQEMGHALGLGDHRTDQPVVPSCMAPLNQGPHPNQDDFDQLSADYP